MGETKRMAVLARESRTIESLRALLGRFEGFNQQQIQGLKPIDHFLARFAAAERAGLSKQQQKWEVDVAPRFNVFQVLRIERRETKLHSRFLADLLNPRGYHCQEDYFLILFLNESYGLRRPS